MSADPTSLSDGDIVRLAREIISLPSGDQPGRRNERAPLRQAQDRLLGGGNFVLDQPESIPALWGEGDRVLWAEGEGLMIAGKQGLGKTTIAQQLVLARVGVRPPTFLGLPVQQSDGRTLYLAMDRPSQAARSMRRMVSEGDRERLNDRLLIWKGPLPVNVTLGASVWADWVEEQGSDVDLVVVDSLKDLAPGLTDDATASGINSAWQELITRGVQVVVLHHERKTAGGSSHETALDSIYGSTWLTSGLGSVLALSGRAGDSEVKLHHLKQPGAEVGPLALTHDHRLGVTTTTREVSIEQVFGEADGPMTIAQIAIRLGCSSATATRRIKGLVEAGRVSKAAAATQTSGGKVAATYAWCRQSPMWS
ncbi:AAA family ATPase [Herbiconiux sp. YIM B11900]|uniref:AAA family ATPase n=1 Tax=Herbiconiux sp. YIM B11900 TaxID=3404131 RepID=UPI003F840A65